MTGMRHTAGERAELHSLSAHCLRSTVQVQSASGQSDDFLHVRVCVCFHEGANGWSIIEASHPNDSHPELFLTGSQTLSLSVCVWLQSFSMET